MLVKSGTVATKTQIILKFLVSVSINYVFKSLGEAREGT